MSVLEGPEGGLGEEENRIILSSHASVRSNSWMQAEKGSSTCFVASGNASTAKIAASLKVKAGQDQRWRAVENSPELALEVATQRKVTRSDECHVRNFLRLLTRDSLIRQAFKDIMSQLEQNRRATSAGQDRMGQARRLLKKAESIRAEMQGNDGMEGTWVTFKVNEARTYSLSICASEL